MAQCYMLWPEHCALHVDQSWMMQNAESDEILEAFEWIGLYVYEGVI